MKYLMNMSDNFELASNVRMELITLCTLKVLTNSQFGPNFFITLHLNLLIVCIKPNEQPPTNLPMKNYTRHQNLRPNTHAQDPVSYIHDPSPPPLTLQYNKSPNPVLIPAPSTSVRPNTTAALTLPTSTIPSSHNPRREGGRERGGEREGVCKSEKCR